MKPIFINEIEQNIKNIKKCYKKDGAFRREMRIWMLLNVVVALLPFVMEPLFLAFWGYNINWRDFLDDYSLLIFAVSINVISFLIDISKGGDVEFTTSGIVSVIVAFICLSSHFFAIGRETKLNGVVCACGYVLCSIGMAVNVYIIACVKNASVDMGKDEAENVGENEMDGESGNEDGEDDKASKK